MKKKHILLILAVLVLIAAGYVGMRLRNRWTDITGVTTVRDRNTVYMNSKTGKDFEAGSGSLTVGEGQRIHVEYALDAGNFDLAFNKGNNDHSVFFNAPLDNLPATGDVFGKSGVSGKGSLDFEAAPGEYTVFIRQHGAIGSATVTAKAF